MNTSGLSSINSLLSYGTSASYAAQRVAYMTKISQSVQAASGTKATSAAARTSSSDETRRTAKQVSGGLNAQLKAYRSDMTAAETAAASLSATNKSGAFHYLEYGSSDDSIVSVKTKDGGLSGDVSMSVTVHALADEKAGTAARYSVTQNGVTTDYTSAFNEVQLPDRSGTLTLKATGSAELYSGTDTDRIAAAMQKLVDVYNKSVDDSREAGLTDQRAPYLEDKDLKQVGLSVDKNGKFKLDADQLTKSLAADYNGTMTQIGGKYGIANVIKQSAVDKIDDAIGKAVEDTYSGRSSAFGNAADASRRLDRAIDALAADDRRTAQNTFRSMYQFAQSGAYNMTNYYAVGNMLNMLA